MLTEFIVSIFGFMVTGSIAFLAKTIRDSTKTHEESHVMLLDGLKKLLKERIVDICDTAKKAHSIDNHHKDILNGLFTSYTDLNGNGFIVDVVKDVNNL